MWQSLLSLFAWQCYVEQTSSAIVKGKGRRLDLFLRGDAHQYCGFSWGGKPLMELCEAKRMPPISPDDMKASLEKEKIFTGRGDLPVVAGLYRRLFSLVAPTMMEVDFSGMTWSAEEASQLGRVLPHLPSLVQVLPNEEGLSRLSNEGD